jgi:hypothetical protein
MLRDNRKQRLNKVRWAITAIALLGCTHVSIAQEQEQTSQPESPTMDHSHMPIAVPANTLTPRLSLGLYKDAMSGLNLELLLENFTLIPPPRGVLAMKDLMVATVNPRSSFVEGHAHLYVNGEKIQRLYGPNVHLPDARFHAGLNQVTVTISNHGHMYWTADKRQVLATLFINLAAEDPILHRFESFPVTAPKEFAAQASH